ncbi:MAG: hypothetical protein DI533_08800 [Cereibacter sphaeroides]|uniref:Uncharacterized protein n=1 Tax=Cereibacter sphaeroides TaxID=1063 RepID=A0A2W5SFM0_CERSP|nr:MAG: hypothetical protein DI533_08800 [Cereibacter sphaeroides]
MVTTANNLNFFLREMERQYPKSGPEAARLRRRIAQAAFRGSRKARERERRDVILACVVAGALSVASILAGAPGGKLPFPDVVAMVD